MAVNTVVVYATNNKLRNISSKQTLLRFNGMEIMKSVTLYEFSCKLLIEQLLLSYHLFKF